MSMKISVCIAVYNGEKYIKLQILSILEQINEDDELLIVNDCSIDKTIEIIENTKDKRIKIISNDTNLGTVESFEKSIANASGNIIFLSDQDDIWMPGKVEKFCATFNENSKTTLAISDAVIINESGQVTADSFFAIRGSFRSDPFSNIIKNKYHGCTLAFRKEMLEYILPFPKDLPMHDIWVGIVSSIFGEVVYIDEPLIQHRRHDSNTGRGMNNNAGIVKMLRWRMSLIKNILILVFKNRAQLF